MPKVSVIIPVYNLASLVGAAIQSVLTQTYQDFEIVVVDDGSVDDTATVVAAVGDPRVRYIYQTNRGLAGARNTGIAQARGQYIAFLDADDLFLPNKLAQQVQALDSQPELGLVAGGYLLTDKAGQPLAERRPWTYSPQFDIKTWLYGCPFVVHAVLIRREWLVSVDGFDPGLRRKEDVDLWLRLTYRGCRMAWLPEVVCVYRMHGGQMVRDGLSQQETGLAVLDKFFTQPDLPPDLVLERQRAYAYQYLEGACRQYAANQVEGARQSLAKAIELEPALISGDMPPLFSALVSWAIDPIIGDPITFISCVQDNLPISASYFHVFRERMLLDVAIRAAIGAHLVGNHTMARRHLADALQRDPTLAHQSELTVELLVDYVRSQPPERQTECIEVFFDNLPPELMGLLSFRRKTLGRFYVAKGFEAHAAGVVQDAAQAIWRGVRFDPAWLWNRGVWSIMLRPWLGHLR